MTPTRRNDPCPCGSGRRYKDCHGKLAGDIPVDALLQQALLAHQQGRIDEAEPAYRDVLARDPGNAVATHYLGMVAWARGDLDSAEREMHAALAADATVPDFHNNLGLLMRDTRRIGEAIACFRSALGVDPAWYEASNNLGLALEAAGDWDGAVAAYRDAIARAPRFAPALQNLARVLLTRGEYAEGWALYRWRLYAQGVAAQEPDLAAAPFPATLAGRELAIVGEQGLGDVLFFLRFAPELVRRGARLAFNGDARLHSMLERTGLFVLGFDPHPRLEAIAAGDLPWLLEANDAARFPRALALSPEAGRLARWRDELRALGPAPRIALTWRAGLALDGPARTQLKALAPEAMGAALRGVKATWISIQRLPRNGEHERLAEALAAPVHDLSAINEDLEDALAVTSLVDEYLGVSNANTHLRAATGGSMQVLVPHPPEWRWGLEGARSPWFPAMRVHRQRVDGSWDEGAWREALA